jgi:hypothetical protein
VHAGCFVDTVRVVRQFVVEAIEINALASRDQAFNVLAAEVEMPGVGA